MFGKLWQWAEDQLYAALTRGAQRFVNDMSNPVQGERPQLMLTVPAALIEVKDGKKRKE